MMGLPDCRTVAQQLSLELDLRASPEKRAWRLRLHLLMCRHCRRYARQLYRLDEMLRIARERNTLEPRLSDEARARIARRIRDAFEDNAPL